MKIKGNQGDLSLKESIDELLGTCVIRYIARRNGECFAQEFTAWLLRYILVIASMNESLQKDLDEILYYFHSNKVREILELTESVFQKTAEERS